MERLIAPLRLAAPAARWLRPAVLAGFVLLLLNMYFVRSRLLSDLVVATMGAVALLSLVAGGEERRIRHGIAAWLGAAGLLLLATAVLAAEVDLREGLSGLHSLALIAAFLLFARALFRHFGIERVLLLLFAAAALSAAASLVLHLATTEHPLARLAMLGRGRNPIPAAAAIGAGGLAGLALLRAGWGGMAGKSLGATGLVAVAAAMLLTQSRGPLIGAVLAAAMLLVPGRWRPAAWVLPLATFLLCSLLILGEAPLRSLFCADEALFCRPSERLPLWQQSAALIAAHPWTGLGAGHQIGTGWLNNPQNAALGIAVYFGLPFLCATLAGAALLLRRLGTRERTPAVRWAEAMTVFSAAYFAFEPNPFAFYNAHYVALWLPVAVVLSAPAAAGR